MKLATFLAPGGAPAAGEVRGDEVVAFSSGTVLDRLASGDRTPADGPSHKLSDVSLLAPVPAPRAIFGIGRNYAAHALEMGNDLPKQPLVFMKLPSSSVPGAGPVRRPAVTEGLDYEAELAVVMGAAGAIAGWAVADDVSCRDLQQAESQWTRAKGFDTSCPWGAVDHARGRALGRGRPADHRLRQQRVAPGLEHVRPRLRPAGAGRLHRPDLHARAGRPHPHRHAERGRRRDEAAALPAAGRRGADRGRAPGRDRAHRPVIRWR